MDEILDKFDKTVDSVITNICLSNTVKKSSYPCGETSIDPLTSSHHSSCNECPIYTMLKAMDRYKKITSSLSKLRDEISDKLVVYYDDQTINSENLNTIYALGLQDGIDMALYTIFNLLEDSNNKDSSEYHKSELRFFEGDVVCKKRITTNYTTRKLVGVITRIDFLDKKTCDKCFGKECYKCNENEKCPILYTITYDNGGVELYTHQQAVRELEYFMEAFIKSIPDFDRLFKQFAYLKEENYE